MLAAIFFQHVESIAPLSLDSHISVQKLYENLIFAPWKIMFFFFFSGSLEIFSLFGFQQLYGDIIGYSHLCIYSLWGLECFLSL